MTRRDVIVLLGGAAIVWCGSARAQQRTLPLVAFLSPRTFAGNIDAFRSSASVDPVARGSLSCFAEDRLACTMSAE
jgi:hypothetical protein